MMMLFQGPSTIQAEELALFSNCDVPFASTHTAGRKKRLNECEFVFVFGRNRHSSVAMLFTGSQTAAGLTLKEKKKVFLQRASVHVPTFHTTEVKSERSHQICRYKFKVGGRRCSGSSQAPPPPPPPPEREPEV